MRAITAAVWSVVLGGALFGCKEPETIFNLTDVTLSLDACLGPVAAADAAERCGARLDEAVPEGAVNACLLMQKQGMTPEVYRVPMRWASGNFTAVGRSFPAINPGESYAAELIVRTEAGDARSCDALEFGVACGEGCLVKLSQGVRQVARNNEAGDQGVALGGGNTLDFTDGRGQCLIEQGPTARQAFAAREICDQVDNDCDGQVDEGFVCAEDCETDANCADTPATPVCVNDKCVPCRLVPGDGAIHDGCGPGQLCCGAADTPACVAVDAASRCTDCDTGCGLESDFCTPERSCGCAANEGGATCAAPTPFCTPEGCVNCRDLNDCGAGQLCCNSRCIDQSQSDCGECGQGCDITATDRCVAGTCQCGEADACGAGRPYCRTQLGQPVTCVECEQDGQCGDNRRCLNNRCAECEPGAPDQCTFDPNRPICTPQGACVGCSGNAECALQANDLNFCVDEVCRECDPTNNDGCDPFSPICRAGVCTPCQDSADCGPGSECFEGRCEGCNPATQEGCFVELNRPYCDQVTNQCRGCASDVECEETAAGRGDQCVEGRCEACDPTDHAGCGPDQLCCVGQNGAPACVDTDFSPDGPGCEACAREGSTIGLCDPNLTNVCQGRRCLCAGDDRACRAPAEVCDPRVGGGTCAECRDNADCPLDRLCCDGSCVPTGPGNGEICETCDPVVGLGSCDVQSTNRCEDRSCLCGLNEPCGGDTPVCDDPSGQCVQCRNDGDCGGRPGTPECVGNRCVQCDRDDGHRGCGEASATPICADGSCRACNDNAECLTRPGDRDLCVNRRCVRCDPATNPATTGVNQPADGCNRGAPICADGACRACRADPECGAGQECVNGQCELCNPDDFATCGGVGSQTPICDAGLLSCRSCRNDGECPVVGGVDLICTPGDGRCVPCELGTHRGCGPDELCCGAPGQQTCVATNLGRCGACEGAGSACDPDTADRCEGRRCSCGPARAGDSTCRNFTPFCAVPQGQCVACRDEQDCVGLGARNRCIQSDPGDPNDRSASCEVCDPESNGGCDNTRTQPICRRAGGVSCTACSGDAECAARGPAGRGQCVANGSCQVCDPADDAGCGGNTPVCDGASFACRGCRADFECQVNPNNGDLCHVAGGSCFSCQDGQRNGTETGQDCGGPQCRALGFLCVSGRGCTEAADCVHGVCFNGRCQAPACNDNVRNGNETDVDCGGATCRGQNPPRLCAAGLQCAGNDDCQSNRCVSGRCAEATCNDGVRNGGETGVDCGGPCRVAPLTLTCPDGVACGAAADCASGVCTAGTCRAPACNDAVRNGLESDVDCGGGGPCPRCADGRACVGGADCSSGICRDGQCQAPACNDGVRNGQETDVDCGGPTCPDCRAGQGCAANGDCISNRCTGGLCVGDSCSNGRRDPPEGETGVDCGGPCAPCGNGIGCAVGGDCVSGVCFNGLCQAPTCNDTVRNGDETDVDCGGPLCTACPVGDACALPRDCVEGVCSGGVCQAPTCIDAVRNGQETGTDCGGPVCRAEGRRCPDLAACEIPGDCVSGVCQGGTCQVPTCDDEVQNGAETATDCGGGTCAPCANNQACLVARDCQSGVCTGGLCRAPTCNDGVENGQETDVDCGGATCRGQNLLCADGRGCAQPGDCQSGVCEGGVCQVPACDDGVENGLETDEDCGGALCRGQNLRCADGEGCSAPGDCVSNVCAGGICQVPTCEDAARNGQETDVDCGGPVCPSCAAGRACGAPTDCASGVCRGGRCQAPTCDDEVQNGTETDEDCGGPGCPGCPPGDACLGNGDCASALCVGNVCAEFCENNQRDADNGETDVDCGGPNCGPCALGQACAEGSDCPQGAFCADAGADLTCQVCDPADHDGCGANQLCCANAGVAACVDTDPAVQCEACGQACPDVDAETECVNRSCQ